MIVRLFRLRACVSSPAKLRADSPARLGLRLDGMIASGAGCMRV